MSKITHKKLKLIQGFIFFIFFFISLSSYSQTPRFTDPTLYSGIDKTAGAKYRYTNVTNVNGTDVDAILSVVSIKDATIVDIDNPNNGSGSLRDRFQPVITTKRSNGYVQFTFDFYKAGTYGTPQELKIDLSSFTFEALDLDGNEFFDVLRPSNELIILELNSFLTILPNLIDQFTRIQGPSNSVDPISITNTRYIAAINYGNVNSVTFRLGNSTQSSNRQSSISFGEVTFSVPTAPTANNDNKLCNTYGPVSIDVTANDVDANRNLNTNSVDLNPTAVGRQTTLSVTNQGNWSVNNTGVVTFTPLTTFKGDPTPIRYTISDSTPLMSNEATITITYTPEKPIASVTSQPTCAVATGSITVSSPTGNGLTYSINGTNYQNTSGIFTNIPAGTYSVTAKSSSGCISSATSLTINSQPATPNAPVSGGNQTVCSDGSTTQTLTATATGGTITWYDSATAGNVVNAPTQVGVGTKTYYAQASNGTCSSLTRTAVTLTITPLPGQPIATNYEYCQDAIAQPLSANASSAGGTLFYFSSLNGTPQTSITPSTTTAGQFTYYVAEQRNSCFGPKSPITVIVHPKTIISTQPISKAIIYGNSTTFTISSSNATAYQWQVNTGSGFSNITNNSIYSNATTSTLTVNNPAVSMNSYLYRVILTGTGNCNQVTSSEATLTVTPKAATVVAVDKTKVYGAANPALTATVTGAISGDTINYTLATTATTASNVGAYPIVVTLGSNPNYTVTKTDATLTVTPKAATVVAVDKTKVYGDANPALTATVTGTISGDTINYSLATTATTTSNVGAYPIAVTLGSNPNYTISKTDATLTVTPKTATVVAANKTKVYGDANPALTATVTGAINGDTINYTLATTATTASNVGAYPISVTLGSNPNYTVSKTDATLTVTPKTATVVAVDKTKVYGDANPALTATVTGTISGDTINYSLATTATTTSNIGTYPITVTLGSNPNYTVTKTDATLTVTPKTATVVAVDKTKIYGDVNPALTATVTGTISGDTINYSLATTATTTSNIGTYPITVTLGSNPNYTVTKTDATLTVTPKTATVVAVDKTKIYGDVNPALTATVTGAISGDTINYTLATTASTTSNIGTYPITVTLGSNPNYTVTKTDATLTVTPKTATVVAVDKTKIYGDVNPALTATVTGTISGDTINYSLATTATTTSNIGTYPITVTLGSNPNYTVTKTDATLTVTPKTATVVAVDKTKIYGDVNPALTATVTGAISGDTINYTLATTASTTSNIGTYPIVVTLGSNPNYTVSKTDATLTVTPKTATVVAADKTKVYGDANPTLTATVTGAISGDTINYTLATTASTTSNIGTYPIVVTLGSNPNYTVSKTDATLTVTPKTATVVAADKTKVYGDANPTLTATVTGAISGDTINYSLATTATTTSNVGAYPISVTLGSNPNYTVSKTDATLTVTPKTATVVAVDKTKVYGDANPALTATVTGAINGDTINYTLATTATTTSNVGTYPIAVTLGTNPNYTVTKTDANLTITPKTATVVAADKTKVYGDVNPALTATVTGAIHGDTINYTLATTATTASNVGAYPISVTLGSNPNYTVSKTDATLTVTPKTATVVAVDKTKVYGYANPALTATVTGAINGDTINYTLATTATTTSNVGTYPIAVTLGTNPNYTVTKTDANLTITPKTATVVAADKTKVYGDVNPALTAVVTGGVNGDTINYTLATTATTTSNVGTYPIVATLGSNPNYTVTKTDANLTVTPKTATVVAADKTKVYGDVNPTLTATVTGAINGDNINYTLATTATTTSNIGTYPIAVTLGTNPNYTVTKTDATLTVTPKTATVVATDKTKVYGDVNPTLTAVVTGAINGDTINYTLATTATTTSNVGTYPIVVTLGTNPNYSITPVNGTLTVTPKAIDVLVTADNKTKVYGEANPALTAVVTGAVNGDVIDYSLATPATQFSNVGAYPIEVTLGNNPNYNITPVNGTLTVTPKAIDVLVTADNKTKVYGEANPALTAVVTGAVNGDTINYTLATSATQFSNVGSYPIVVTLGSNPNYNITPVNGTLTVTPKAIDVLVTADNKTKVYGEANPALTAVVTGAVNGDVIDYSLATPATQFSNVGAYPIEVTLGNNPNYNITPVNGTLTVTPKAIDVLVTADNKTKVYGEANPALTAVVTGAVNGDTINYTLATSATQFSNVGSYPIVVTLGSNPNYNITPVNGTLTVTPKAIDVLVTADNKTKVYGEANPALTAVVTGAVNGDTINYTLATSATQFSNVGSYPIVVTLGSNPNYNITPVNGTLTVTPKAIDVLVTADNKTKVYGEANPALTAVVTGAVAGGDAINYTLATTATQFSNVGSYPIVVTLGSNPNYNITPVNGTLTVTPKAIDVLVTADDKTKVYGDINPALTAVVTGAVNGDVIDYSLATTATQFSNVGTYPIVVTLGTNHNYNITPVNGNLTVTPKAIDVLVTADDKTKVYGDLNPALTAVVTGAVAGGDAINYTLATTATQFSNVGTYPIVVTLGSNPNYTVTPVNGTLTVTPKAINVLVTANDKTKVYGEANPALTAVVTGAVAGGDAINYTLATTATQFSNVGTYPIVVTLGSNPNYTVTPVNGTLTVTPKAIDVLVTADDKTKVYGEANPALTAVVTGAVAGGDTINYTLATTATQFSNVGTYPIVVTLGTNPNYTVTPVNGTLTVTPKAIDVLVTADDKTKVYGEANPALTAVVTGTVASGDAINYTLATTATQFSNVGTYPIVVTLGSNPNYTVTPVNGTLTVTPKAIDVLVTANDKTKVYGEANPALTAVVTGAVAGGDAINYTLATTATQFSNVGTYPIVVTLGSNPNYTVTPVNGTLTVTPKAIDVLVTADDKTKVYGEANPALTAVVTGAVAGGDAINYTLATTATQFSNVGTYPIVVTLGSNPNYTVTPVNGTLTVTPKAINVLVTANDKTKVYGEANPALTAVVSGAVNGDVIDYSLATSATQFSNAGAYPIVVTLGTNPNYNITPVNGTLTVTPKAIDVVVTADDKTKVYGEANPALTAVVTGAVNGDVIDYSLATPAMQFSNVGSYPIVVTLGTNPNYNITPVNGTLTVTPKAIDVVVTADDKTKVYGEANPALTALVTGAVAGGDAINYNLTTPATQFSNVGSYPIVVTLGSNPNYNITPVNGTLTVTPKAIDVVVTADDKTKVYGEANPALTAVVTGAVAGGDAINYNLTTPATQFSNVGSYPIVVTLGSNPNYNITPVNGTLTVTPKAIDVVVTADDKTKVYGEANPALTAVVTGAVNGDTINYTLSTSATQFSNVGSYPIVVTLGTNPNYRITPVNGTLTVTPKAIDVLVTADNKTKVYGEANPALTAVVTGAVAGGDAINYSLATSATQFSNVGSYPIVVTLGSNPNYTVTPVNGTLTVTPKAIDVLVTADNKTKVYGEANPALTAVVTGAVNGDTINYTLATSATQFSNVGSYPIEVTLGSNPNYTVTPVNGTLTVTPKAIDVLVTADNKTKVYGEANPALTAVVTGAVAGGDVINYSLATTATQFSNVGSYPIVVTLGSNPNYNITPVNGTLTVTPKAIDVLVTADNKTKVYGEANPALTAVVTGAVNGDVIDYSLATTATQFSNVGSYPIVVTLGSNPNYTVTAVNGTLTVTPKAIDVLVTADEKTKVYGDVNPDLTAVVTGAVNGDTINYTLATSATQFSNVGSYPIEVTLGTNPNYTVTPVNGTLTVTPKAIDVLVTADNKTKVYGEANPALTAVVTGAVAGGDVINYSLATTATQFSNVGSYPIVVTLGSNPNYNITPVNGTLTVTPKAIDVLVTADNKTKVYGEANPALTAVVTGAVNGDVIDYSLATTATQFSNVGSYPIVVTLGSNPNYNITPVNGTLTVTPKAIDVVVTADDKTKVYGDLNPALTAVVTGAVNGDTINYTLATSATQFSNVGSYPIVVTLGTNPNYSITPVNGTLTVTPKAINVLVTADDKTKVYGEANPALTAVVTGAVNGDTINYTLATSATQFSNVGSYPIVVTLGTNPNYNITPVNGTLTVTPKAIDVLVTADNKTKVYGDINPTLTAVVTGAVNGDTINYTLETSATQFSNVGSYPIEVTLGTNPNYNITPVNGTLTVTPKAIDVVVTADDKTKVYGDLNPALTAVVTGAVNGDTINYTLATSATQFSNVGAYPIVVTLGTNPNYNVTAVNGTLTVTPKAIDVLVTADDKTKVYGEANPALTAVVTGAVAGGDTINYTLATSATQFSNVGSYPIVVTLGTNPNYNITPVNGTLTVTPKDINVLVTADDKTKVYGEANPALTAVVTGAVAGGDTINYTLATSATQFSNVGSYPIVVTLGTNPNYNITPVNGTLTVTPKDINVLVTADDKTKVYGEANPALTAVVTGAVAGGDTINYTLATSATQFSNVGSYPIVVTLGTNPNYNITPVNGTLTVTPKAINVLVTADDKTKVYGEANPALTAVVTGAVNGDTINYTLATSATQFSNVGSYPIVVTLGTNPNYSITPVNGTLTVTPKAIDVLVTADDKTKVYGEANPALTAVVTGAVNGDTINYTLATSATQFSNVGAYPIVVTLGTNPNYNITPVNGTLTVTPKAIDVVVTADDKTKVYGDINPALTAVVTGAVNGDTINYTLATSATQFSNVGSYPIVVTLGTNPNYNITPVNGTLTVTPKAIDVVVTADDKTKVYGDLNPALTAVVTGAVNGDTINYTLATSATQFSNVGSYPIVVTLGSNPNYNITPVNGTLTVTPKAIDVVVTADDKTKVYGDLNPALTAVVDGAVNGDTINYTLATTATQFSNVGSYPIVVTLGSNPNYTVTPVNGTLTVTPKAIDILVTADDKTKVYGDANPALTAVVTGAVAGGDTINYTLATTATQFSNVGSYPIVVTLGSNPNYTVTAVNGTLTVTPKAIDVLVTADDKTKVYGDLNPTLTAVVTGAVNGDVIDYSLATSATQFSNVGSYPIVVTLGSNPNYTVTAVNGTLTVTPKAIDVLVTADDKTKVYGEANPALTAVVTGAVNGDVIDYSLATSATQFSNVGSYPIVVTLGNNPNYNVTAVNGTLTVTPKAIDVLVTADDKTKVYGEANPALTAVVTGAVNGDVIDYSLATSATQFSNVGSYPIVVTLGNNPNYNVTAVNGTLTVTPLKILAKDDAITATAGTTDAGNVLLDNGSGKDTLNGEQATTTLVVITVTRPATSATNSPVPVLNPSNGQVSIPFGTIPGTYEIKYEICEIINPTNCSNATVIITVNEPTYNPGISVLKEGTYVDKDGNGKANIGDVVQYTFVIKNTGDVDLTNVVLTDNNAVVNGGPIALLAVGATNSTTYTAVHTITQNDIDAGFVYNLATVKGSLPNGSTISATSTDPTPCTTCPVIPTCTTCTITPISQNPSLLVVKTSSTENYISVGDIINYTIKVTNNGNVTLAQIVVTDPLTGMNETIDTLLPGASKEYEQSYRVTQSDITNLSVTNVAFAKGKTPQNNEVSTSDDAVVEAAIVLGCGNIKVRNAFSPNGDGINEVFVIDNIDATCYPENTVEIYNRWGVLVFETKNYNNETNNFDGTSRGRSTIQQSAGLPTGTYFYILTYKSVDDSNRVETKKLDGYLYLSR